MGETVISFESEGLTIDGRLAMANPKKGVIITHPHPLFGGNMDNPVVQSVKTVYQQKGYSTLRFNFRGTGKSEGSYDEGRGEREDLRAGICFLQEKGIGTIYLAGYSFGTWINAAIAGELAIRTMVMVSPPVAMLKFEIDRPIPSLKLVATGDEDEFAPPRLIRPLLRQWNPEAKFESIDDADRFFFGHLDELKKILLNHID